MCQPKARTRDPLSRHETCTGRSVLEPFETVAHLEMAERAGYAQQDPISGFLRQILRAKTVVRHEPS